MDPIIIRVNIPLKQKDPQSEGLFSYMEMEKQCTMDNSIKA